MGIGCEVYHGNKNITSRDTNVSTRGDGNFSVSTQPKEQFLKKILFLQTRYPVKKE